MADSERGTAEDLAAQSVGVNDGSDVGDRQIVRDMVPAGFEVDFHLRKSSAEGVSLAVVRHGVASHCQQSLPGQEPWPKPQ